MNPDYNLCDICFAKTKLAIWIATDTQIDASGDSDEIGRNYDLCEQCILDALKYLVSNDGRYEQGRKLTKWLLDSLGAGPKDAPLAYPIDERNAQRRG